MNIKPACFTTCEKSCKQINKPRDKTDMHNILTAKTEFIYLK